MRRVCVVLLVVSLCLAIGCASTREAITAFFTPRPKTPEEEQAANEIAKANHDRKVKEYESKLESYNRDQALNDLWRKGYGFNNPNAEKVLRNQGEQTEDFSKNLTPYPGPPPAPFKPPY